MGRKNTMDTRLDSFDKQWDKRKYQKKLRTEYRNDTIDWTQFLLKKLKRSSNGRRK